LGDENINKTILDVQAAWINWKKASEIAGKTEVILAGGLDLTNVEKAIRIVSPWGVDISSGVESAPGIKDPKKIKDFINCVRIIERAK